MFVAYTRRPESVEAYATITWQFPVACIIAIILPGAGRTIAVNYASSGSGTERDFNV